MRISLIFAVLLFATFKSFAEDVYFSCDMRDFVNIKLAKTIEPYKQQFMMSTNSQQVKFGGGGGSCLESMLLPMQTNSDRNGHGPLWTAYSHWLDTTAAFVGRSGGGGRLHLSETSILGVKVMTAFCTEF